MKDYKVQSLSLFWLCLSAALIAPLANDLFAPGLPAMGQYFSTDHIGLTISFYLFAMALAQLILGPLLDHFGRRPVLLVGLCFFTLGSICTVLSSYFPIFLLGRFLQGFGACACIIVCIVAVKDTSDDANLLKRMGILLGLIGVAPSVAPFVGGYLTQYMGWRSTFYLLLIIGLVYLVVEFFFFKETGSGKSDKPFSIQSTLSGMKSLLTHRRIALYTISAALSYGSFFLYIASAPHIFEEIFSKTPIFFGEIGLFFGGVIFAFSFLIPRISKIIGPGKTVLLSSLLHIIGCVFLVLSDAVSGDSVFLFVLSMTFVVIAFSAIRPTAISIVLQESPKKMSGTATALFNFVIFVLASLITSGSGVVKDSIMSFSVGMLVLSLLLTAIVFFAYLSCKKTTTT